MGSKARHARELLPLVLADRQPGQWYFEPFVGGANMIDKVGGLRCGTDINAALIALLVKVRDGWVPPERITEAEYGHMKLHPAEYPRHLLAFAGFGCSFGSQWFGTFARGNDAKGSPRNYARETRDHLIKQAPKLPRHLFVGSYDVVRIPQDAIIYCDPPYSKTTNGYGGGGALFDPERFWSWASAKARHDGHQVFVSEYTAPEGWRAIWEKKVSVSVDSGRQAGSVKQNTEKLWVPE